MRGDPEAGPAPECMVAVRACPAPRGRSRDALAAGARGAPRLLPALHLRPLARAARAGLGDGLDPGPLRAAGDPRLGRAPLRRRPWSARSAQRAPALTEVAFVDAAAVAQGDEARTRAPARVAAARPQPHVRGVRDRPGQPARPRGGPGGRRVSRRGLQPALPPRPAGARQDPPAGRDRRVPAPQPPRARGPLHDRRAVHDRVRRRAPARGPGGVQGALSRARRAADRRRPGARGQAAHRGGVRPHLQHPALGRQADRALVRPPARGALEAGRAAPRPLQLGAAGRARASRSADPDRGPLADRLRVGRPSFPTPACCRRSPPTCPRTSACSRAR